MLVPNSCLKPARTLDYSEAPAKTWQFLHARRGFRKSSRKISEHAFRRTALHDSSACGGVIADKGPVPLLFRRELPSGQSDRGRPLKVNKDAAASTLAGFHDLRANI